MLFGLIRHCYHFTLIRDVDGGVGYGGGVVRCYKKLTTLEDINQVAHEYLEKQGYPDENRVVLSIEYLGLDWSIREGD